ncbi:MAG TPA: hypothetical protein VF493_12730 [Terriglobales bacterium]
MPPVRPKIIVASRDPVLADVRKKILENAGFNVISVSDPFAIDQLCSKHKVSLVMLGYSLPPAQKRQIWHTARQKCNAPILELHMKGKPELLEQNVFYHEAHRPDDFIDKVRELLRRPN